MFQKYERPFAFMYSRLEFILKKQPLVLDKIRRLLHAMGAGQPAVRPKLHSSRQTGDLRRLIDEMLNDRNEFDRVRQGCVPLKCRLI